MPHSAASTRFERVSGAPRLPWARVFLSALALLAFSIGGLEAHWRGQGLRPTVSESLGLWYYWRQQVYPQDGKVVVLAGSSRVCAGISLATMREYLPDYRVVQLGILGPVSCIGLLKDLVDDPAFRGIVICELDAPLLERSEWDGHRDFRAYQPPTITSLVDVVTKSWLQDRLVLLTDRSTVRKLFAALLDADPASPRVKMRRTFTREVRWDFGLGLEGARRKQEIHRGKAEFARRADPTWKTIIDDARDIDAMVQRLRARGGDVVFLRAPSTGKRWIQEEESHPRAANWDRFARLTTALCIHFQDVQGMRALTCPDESHLDYRDSPQFTRALISKLSFLATAKRFKALAH